METLCPTSVVSNSPRWLGQSSTRWTKEENKKFESALAIFDEKTPNRWFKVAAMIPGKSVYDVMNQYNELVADVSDIEAGLVPVPGYGYLGLDSSSFTFELEEDNLYRKKGRSTCDQERKKGVPWTQEEHRRFLLGLQKYGKGDWRNISRNFVISKTPTQVASHAQKYYLRQLSGGKDKRRPSIHDITTVDLSDSDQNNDNSCLVLDKSLQNPIISTPKVVFDDSSFVAYPHNVSRYILNLGASSPGFYNIHTPRFLHG